MSVLEIVLLIIGGIGILIGLLHKRSQKKALSPVQNPTPQSNGQQTGSTTLPPSVPPVGFWSRRGNEIEIWWKGLTIWKTLKPLLAPILCAAGAHVCLREWSWYKNLADRPDQTLFWVIWIGLTGFSIGWKKWITPSLFFIGMLVKVMLVCFPNLDTSNLEALVERQGTPSQQEVESPPPKVKKVFTTAGDWTFVEIPRVWQTKKLHWRITTNFTSYEVRTGGNKIYTFDPRVAAVMPTVGQRFLEFKTPESGIVWLSDHPITDSELDE